MLPGGKSNLARTPLQVLARELREEEPLIFVEVALVKGVATAMAPLLSQDAEGDASRADTAIFYSISNCQDGLRGVSFGNFLIMPWSRSSRRSFRS